MRLQFGLSSTSGRLCYRTRTQYGATSFLSGDSDHCKYHRDAAAARLASAKKMFAEHYQRLVILPMVLQIGESMVLQKNFTDSRIRLLGEDLTRQGIECQGQFASMLRPLEGVSDFSCEQEGSPIPRGIPPPSLGRHQARNRGERVGLI